MPIEIRELIIKTTVEKKPVRGVGQNSGSSVNKAELKKEILNSCKKMVKKIIKENKER